jgi:RNA polymerase sigma factor (sigma-70 family)
MAAGVYLSAAANCSNTMLLERAAGGEQSAWEQLIFRYDGFVRSVARSFRLQPADVHDVAQTTWLRLVLKLHTIRDPDRLAAWLAVTASRESLAVLRGASRHALVAMVDETPDPANDVEMSVENRDTAQDLWAAVAELPARQRSLLIALFRDELDSYQDVAARCAMPIGSIGPTRARALSQLEGKLAARGLRSADL